MLTAAFVAAIASYSARGQELKYELKRDDVANNNSSVEDTVLHEHRHYSGSNATHKHRGFFGWMKRRKNNTSQPAVVHNGFGNTMRPIGASKAGS